MNSHSGTNSYRYNNLQIEELPYFLYEVSIYKVYKNRSNLLSNKFYKSEVLLNVCESKVIKKFNKFSIICFVTLLGAPISFIKENNLQIFNLHEKRKSRNRN